MTTDNKAELIATLQKSINFQNAAWLRVIQKARAWQLLETQHTVVNSDGMIARYIKTDAEVYAKAALNALLYDIQQACIEDSLVGAQAHSLPPQL